MGIEASRWGLNACVCGIISLLYAGPWIACESFGSWILGVSLWYFLKSDILWSLVREALDVFVGGFGGSVRTRQRCLCPGAFQGGGIRRAWRYGRGRGETTLLKFHVKLCLLLYIVVIRISRIGYISKHLQSRMDWNTGLLSQPTEVLSVRSVRVWCDLPAMYATLVVCT